MSQGGSPAGGSLFQQMYSVQQQQLQQQQQMAQQQGYGDPSIPPPSLPSSPPQQQQQQQQQYGGAQGGAYGQGSYAPPPPSAYGGFNAYPPPQQQMPPPQYNTYAQAPPPPPPPPPPMFQPPVQDDDYYKGFHDGVVRPSGPVWGNAVSWLVPLVVNVAFFVGPVWYFRRRYMQAMSGAAGSAAGGAGGKGGAASNPMSGLMDMMNPMKSKNFRTEVKGTSFKDVIGIPEAKEDLKQYVDFLKEPAKFTRLGARLPKGCLLTGQPGTGKTLLARAVAGEASTPFFSCSGADFIEIFGGSGPKRVRELFEEAKKAAPCVVFIDEIDAIGSRNQGGRSMGGGGSSEENRTINQLLAELDGLTSKEAIVVIAATNYPEAIDKALLREGRFDRKVNIPMPDQKARCELFEFYLNRVITGDPNCKPKVQVFKTRAEGEKANSGNSGNSGNSSSGAGEASKSSPSNAGAAPDTTTKTLVSEDAAPESIKVIPGVSNKDYAAVLSDRTPGVSPAQISTIVNEGALNAAMNGKDVVPLDVLQDSIDDVLIGKKHRQRMSATSLHRTAYHEVGHCIMAWVNPLQKDVIKLSIIPRGRAGGYTQQVQDEAMEPHTDEFLFSQLCVLMGGRAAERIFEKDISIGAMDDLQRATRLAMEKLLKYGMSKTIGQLAFKPNDKNDGRAWMTWSENLHAKVEAEARALVEAAYVHTEKTLLAHKEQHQKLAELLLSKKELDKADITGVLGTRPVAKA